MPRSAKIALIILVCVTALLLWLTPITSPVPHVSGTLRHDAYVWQRRWTDSHQKAIERASGQIHTIVALAAEVEWHDGQPRAIRVNIPYDTLKAQKIDIGLALRIGSYSGPFDFSGPITTALCDLAHDLVAKATDAGVHVAELQIDFDCAESKLDGYRTWMQAMREKLAPTPVIITSLPSWLDSPAMARLVEATDGFILQVHSLDRPKREGDAFTLCDPSAARRAVERAGRLPAPFRVALPTYGYLVAFDANGKYIGLSAEGPSRSWPEGAKVRTVSADASDMAQLVREWSQNRPSNMTGVIWYRLPIDEDRLNWRWPTLAAVINGKSPQPELHAELRKSDRGLVEVDLVNKGDGDAGLKNARVQLDWSDARLMASESTGGFEEIYEEPKPSLVLVPEPAPDLSTPSIPAGDRKTIGWLRLDRDQEVQAHVQTPAPSK